MVLKLSHNHQLLVHTQEYTHTVTHTLSPLTMTIMKLGYVFFAMFWTASVIAAAVDGSTGVLNESLSAQDFGHLTAAMQKHADTHATSYDMAPGGLMLRMWNDNNENDITYGPYAVKPENQKKVEEDVHLDNNPPGWDAEAEPADNVKAALERRAFDVFRLERRAGRSRCGQTCGTIRDCIDRRCPRCRYLGGRARHQKNCQRP